jgi:PKD repeat protein
MPRLSHLIVGAMLGMGLSAATASPIFDGTAANAWVLDGDSGQIVGAFTLPSGGPNQWTEVAIKLSNTKASVSWNSGASTESVTSVNLSGAPSVQNVLVNQTPTSYEPLNSVLPQISLAGIEAAISNVGDADSPAMQISPVSGALGQTTAIELQATAGRGNVKPLTVFWKLTFTPPGGSPVVTSLSVSPSNSDEGFSHVFYLVENGDYIVEAWAEQGAFQSPMPNLIHTYTMVAIEPYSRDTDGDGIPDLVEINLGLNPLVADAIIDSDGDGWTDFEERARGTDPNVAGDAPLDSDGDGWSDWDEDRRGTNSADPIATQWPSKPTARRIHEVEYRLHGAFWSDSAHSVLRTGMEQLSAYDLYWNKLYEVGDLPTGTELGTEGLVEANIAIWLRLTDANTDLSVGSVPDMRVPAGDPIILRTVDQADSRWVIKSWVDSTPDLNPSDVTAWLIGQATPWVTVQDWLDGYRDYLSANLVVNPQAVDVSPQTSLGVAMMESVIGWYAELSDGTRMLLGNATTTAPRDAFAKAVQVVGQPLATPAQSWNSLHADMLALTLTGLELELLGTAVYGYFTAPASIPLPRTDTEFGSADLLQGTAGSPEWQYILRVLLQIPLSDINALTLSQRSDLLDFMADADGDGVINKDELITALSLATDPTNTDSDADLIPDLLDPCPSDSDNLCLYRVHQEDDSDGDGIDDPVDNCLHNANVMQADVNGDGIGDACALYANIAAPASDVTLWAGKQVQFSSVVTELGAGKTLVYQWGFGGGATNIGVAQPGAVAFLTPGDYTVTLDVIDQATMLSLGTDTRTVHVIGSGPTVVVGGPYFVTEGQSLQQTASANVIIGSPTFSWSFGDGDVASGNPVNHTYVQNGIYLSEVSVANGFNVPAMDTASVTVSDTSPTASFTQNATAGIAPLTVSYTDTSTAYDGIAARLWDFEPAQTDTVANPQHIFNFRGVYDVLLDVTDGDGSVDQVNNKLFVSTGVVLLDDDDNDGLPNIFELNFGLNPLLADDTLDSDFDGFDHGAEYRAATDIVAAGSFPVGPAPTSYVLLHDHFDDFFLEDRWSLGLESPLANHLENEVATELTFELAAPVSPDELCSNAAVISFSKQANPVAYRYDVFASHSDEGKVCHQLISGIDASNRVEFCAEGNGVDLDITLNAVVGGVTSSSAGIATVPHSSNFVWSLIKTDNDFTLYSREVGHLPVEQATFTNVDLGGLVPEIRPIISAHSCNTQLSATSVIVDSISLLSDQDGDGLPDIVEDPNGDGVVGSGESSVLSTDTDGDGITDFDEACFDNDCLVYNPYDPIDNPTGTDLNANAADTDGDGDDDSTEIANGTDPLVGLPPVVILGDVNNDGVVDSADVLIATRIVIGLEIPTPEYLARGDVAPLVGGVSIGDGNFDIADLLLITRRALGLVTY